MILVLDTTTRKLQAQMGAAATTSNCTITVAYAETTASSFTEGIQPTTLAGLTVTDILAAPSVAATRRVVKAIMIYNNDSVTQTVTVYLDDDGTDYPLVKVTLGPGANWASDDQTGVNVGGGVTDGNKGDIVVGGSGATWNIRTDMPGGAVTLAKMADLTASKLIGREASGSGVPQEIGATGGIEFTGTGTNAAIQVGAFSGDVAKTAGSATLTISNGAVTTSKMGGDVTTAGKALLDDADAAAQRTTLGLGTFATRNVMANTNISPTTTDQTGAVNTRYFATIAGLTNHRDFTLPTPAIGDEIELSIVDGDDLYSLVIVPSSSSITINNGRTSISSSSITVNTTNETFTITKHGFVNGDPLRFATSGGSVPGGITAGTMYYVREATADTFKVEESRGSSAVNLTSSGSNYSITPQEWSRLFIKGEYIRLLANSTTNWQVVVDGRIPQAAELEKSGGSTPQTITGQANPDPGNQIELPTRISDNASISSTTTYSFTPRRSGSYLITGGCRYSTNANAEFAGWVQTYFAEFVASPGINIPMILDNRQVTSLIPATVVSGVVSLTAGKRYQMQGYIGVAGSYYVYTVSVNRAYLSLTEVLK